jgi:hypothetical protein
MSDSKIAAPKAGRPQMPKGYGVPKNNKGLLPWSHVVERLTQAKNYWVCSVRPDGRPHSVPLWAAWVDGALYYDGAPDTIHNRNVVNNPNVSVHLEDGTQALIFEGLARPMDKPDRSLAERVAEGFRAKYAGSGYAPKADQWDNGGLYIIKPTRVLAWTQFPKDVTRWIFEA